MKRKTLRNCIFVLRWILLLFGGVGFISVVLLLVLSFVKGYSSLSDYWQMAYYSFAVFGAIGTVFAVIVALEKEEFNRILYSPEFEVTCSTLSPIKESSASNPDSIKKYSQYLRINNIGAADASCCKVELIKLRFDKNKHGNFKDIYPIDQRAIICGEKEGVIMKQTSFELLLFEVEKPGATSVPEDQEVRSALIKFSGITLTPRHASMGKYKMDFRISCNESISKTFSVEVEWAGEWSDDVEEMIEKFETKVK